MLKWDAHFLKRNLTRFNVPIEVATVWSLCSLDPLFIELSAINPFLKTFILNSLKILKNLKL